MVGQENLKSLTYKVMVSSRSKLFALALETYIFVIAGHCLMTSLKIASIALVTPVAQKV